MNITSSSPITTALNVYQISPGYRTNYGINSVLTAGSSTNIAIKEQCTTSIPMSVGKSYGVLGIGGNHISGYNYGV